MTGWRDVMESALGMDSAAQEPLGCNEAKGVERQISDLFGNCLSKSSVKSSK